MIAEKLLKHCLVDTVRDSVSGSVDDLGESGFSEWLSLSNSRVGYWRSKSNIVVADDVGVSDGAGWVANDAGISKGVELASIDVGVSEGGDWVSNDTGVSEG